MDVDMPSPLSGTKRKQEDMEPPFNEMTTASTSNLGDETSVMNWKKMQSTIVDSIKSENAQGALDVIVELRDNLELVHSTEYPTMLATMLPLFRSILQSIPCTPSGHAYLSIVGDSHHESVELESPTKAKTDKIEHTIRHTIIELCTRLPQNEVLRPYVGPLLNLCMQILHDDYEENALLATRLLLDLHKNYRPSTAEYVQPFLDFVLLLYRQLPGNAQRNFILINEVPDAHPMIPRFTSEALSQDPSLLSLKSTHSFRVLMECPLTVMLLFNLYPKFIKKNLSQLLPVMMESLTHRPPKHAHSSNISSVNDKENENGPVIDIKSLYYKRAREFLSAQVKTLSFVTHLLRGYSEQLKPFENILTNSVLNMFQMCPREAITTRRDLLFSLRHIFATSFRRGFIDHIDTLLDERILVGKLRLSEHTGLKAIAYSTLGDLLLHARSKLTMSQVSRIVHIYSRVLHDASMNLPLTVQTSSARLLITLIDPVYHNKEGKASAGRNIMYRILETLICKIGMLLEHGISDVKKHEESLSKGLFSHTRELVEGSSHFVSNNDPLNTMCDQDFLYGPEHPPIGTTLNLFELIKPLMNGIKTLIWCISNYGNQREKNVKEKDSKGKSKGVPSEQSTAQTPQWYEDASVQSINTQERELIGKYFDWTLEVLKVLKGEYSTDESRDQYRQLLENFASSLTVLDSFNFQRIVGPKMRKLINSIHDDSSVIVIVEHLLLNSSNVSADFAACLLNELMSRSQQIDLGIEEKFPLANLNMSLFSLVFKSVSVHPKNERVLRPYIQTIISICFRRAVDCDTINWPDNHLTLIRKLFRTITNGKNEDSYKEIVPLLATLLNGLYRLFCRSQDTLLRKIVIELCITVPARLSSLLPHLSLLLRVIIPALQSGEGELINAGLRTLEFWVEHLNPDFLFPILTQDEDLLVELISSLALHLQPAPYQYGLLTVRLLGKLGGMNKAFLNVPMNVSTVSKEVMSPLSMNFEWDRPPDSSQNHHDFSVDIPIRRSTIVLECVASMSLGKNYEPSLGFDEEYKTVMQTIKAIVQEEKDFENIDLSSLQSLFIYERTREQAEAAMVMLRSAVELMLDIPNDPSFQFDVLLESKDSWQEDLKNSKVSFSDSNIPENSTLKCVMEGLIHATCISFLEEEAKLLLQALVSQFVYLVCSNHRDVRRVDSISSGEDVSLMEKRQRELSMQNGKLNSLVSFGRFVFGGKLNTGINFFLPTEAIAQALCSRKSHTVNAALDMITDLFNTLKYIDEKGLDKISSQMTLWMESLLFSIVQACFSCTWEQRSGLYDGLSRLLNLCDQNWCKLFELELFHLAFYCLKEVPLEAVSGQKDALVFFRQMLHLLYQEKDDQNGSNKFTHESLFDGEKKDINTCYADSLPLSDSICDFLFSELSNNRSIVRSAARLGIDFLYGGKSNVSSVNLNEIFKKQSSVIRRLLFNRSLRHLQLQDQIATIEAFNFTISHAPDVLPLSDNHTIIFLSELLKIMSVGDGEMTSESIPSSCVVDKDGICPKVPMNGCMIDKMSPLTHSTSIFLRGAFVIVQGDGTYRAKIDGDLPVGVQYRVATLQLFGKILKENTNDFIKAEPTSSLGNILPHIVSLLFRSLASRPEEAVEIAHLALRDILTRDSEGNEGEQHKHGLPRHLLQLCIRPVLLNLRDYTKLTIPLLRGLSRLMSLLSSWFSKTLGEKLLELLQRWYEPEKIINLRQWKQGEEPLVAAELISMFQMLPDESSNFVEPLIKTTLKLEAVLHHYMGFFTESPFRKPLCQYLNKHGPAVVLFFINDRRLKNPIYSELLQDITRRKESSELRKHLSSTECSTILLNVCFERPLAIIRSEKGQSGASRQSGASISPRGNNFDALTMHGIVMDAPSKKTALEHQIKLKEEKLKVAKREECKAKDMIEKEVSSSSIASAPEKQHLAEALKQKHARTLVLVDSADKELAVAREDYANELATLNNQQQADKQNDDKNILPKPMSFDTLELQLQGFALAAALMENDDTYTSEHHNLFRTFRWLWRSKGRHFRLLHEDVMPSRFVSESRYLAAFTVAYSKTAPADIEILFDLVRTFLQPTSEDFTFVRQHLHDTVCNRLPLEQKKKVLMRFLPVIVSEGLEELKIVTCQNIMIPMLKHCLKTSSFIKESTVISEGTDDKIDTSQLNSSKNEVSSLDDHTVSSLIDSEFLQKMADDILAKDTIKEFGSRVTVELLKLCCLLIDYARDQLGDKQQDLVKFAWKVLKCDDPRAKHWAYIAICKIIAYFDAPEKTTLQVYVALLRAHSQDTKDLVRNALDVLLPVLQKKLSSDSQKQAVRSTIKILHEEANSAPHLNHIWYTVVRHEYIFYDSRRKLVPHLISSLNRFGLPSNVSTESKELAIDLVELLLYWSKMQNEIVADEVTSHGESRDFTLNQNEVNTIVNFLVRLVLLLAVADKPEQQMESKISSLFQAVIVRWEVFELRIEYFEKVLSMCENELKREEDILQEKRLKKGDETIRNSQNASKRGKKNGETIRIPTLLLSSCLNIFIHLVRYTPSNRFLNSNTSKFSSIMRLCFKHVNEVRSPDLWTALVQFIEIVYATEGFENMKQMMRYLLEEFLIAGIETDHVLAGVPSGASKSRKDKLRFDVIEKALSLIKVASKSANNLVNSFSKILITVTEKLIKYNLQNAAKDRKAAKSSYTVALINEALFESARANSDNYLSSRASGTSVYSDHKKSEKNENKAETDCLYQCICLLRFDCVVFRLASDRKRYLAIIYDILESISDVRILLTVISQISRWILANDNEMPLTRKELKSLLTSLMLIDEQCLPIIDGEFLMCALALITYQICILYFQSGSQRNFLRNRDEFTAFINRGSIKFLMSSKPEIRTLFCKMVSGETATYSDLDRCAKSPGFQYVQDSISGRDPLDILKHLLASDLQGLAFNLWTFIFNDVLLARTCHDGRTEGSMCTALNMNIVPSTIQSSSESIFHLKNKHALDLANRPTNRATLISALRILASSDSELNQSLLEKLISAAWCSSNDEKHQFSAVPFLEHILLRPYHVQFLKSGTSSDTIGILHSTVNAVKSFLGAINLLDPLPYIDADILISSAVNYSCWHEVRSILEKQHNELTKASNNDFYEHKDLLSSSIRRCYLEIGEKDTWLSLRAEECKLPGLQRAAGHDMYSNTAEALKSYVHLIDSVENVVDSYAEDGVAMELSVAFLEERWVALQRESCAWNVLEEYVGDDGPFKVMIECAWKTKNWEKLRRLCSSPSAVSALELGDMDVKMSEILLAISDGKLNEVENLHAQTAQLCLYNWQLLPSVYSGCDAHSQILHMFNRLVDIRESGQIMVEASHHTNSKSYPDFKSVLNSWRNRLPGTHEQISFWDDIFLWRSHMFSAVTTKFHWVEQNMLAALHDRPWTAIRFAQTAREQGADEIAMMSIGLLSDCAMAVGDAFSKLKEQILLYKNGGENERKAGLNLISTTNLSFFDPSQKSELFRLKGDFLDLIANSYNGKTKASQAYCHAVQLCPTYSRPWVSWGGLCWSLGEILERQHRSLSTETEEEKEKKESMAKKFVQYYAQAMGCYLEAVKCDSSEDSRIFIPRVLLCLAKDGTNPDLLCQTFDKYALAIPAWIWLPWIPQLLSSLCRAEAKTVKSILTSILSAYPQSLYFSLRSFYLERRDIERSRMNKDSSAQSGHSGVSLAEDLMSFLRKNQPILWMSLETIIEELIIRFRPSYEEELLATITALVTRVDTQLENQHSSNDDNDTENESIRASFRKTLTRISTKFFSMPSDSASPSSEQDLRSKRTAEFTVRYKDAFIEDFGLSTLSDSDKQECKLPLDQIIIKLKKWKRILEAKISSTPPTLPLLQASSALSSFTNIIPDLWPGACGPEDDKRDRSDKELDSNQSPKSSFAASVELAEKAALAVRAANAYENYGDGRGGGWISVEVPGQYAPNSISWGKPSPELHVKLVKFESNVEVSRRNQQLVRRIGMMGSNGRIYHFLLQFAIPYWTRADERTAQLHQIFDRCLRKEKASAQRHLWLRPTAVLPVAQRLRMIAEERHHVSLEQIFTQDCKRNGIDEQDISDLFIEEVRKYRSDHQNEVATNTARVHALHVLCKEKVSSSILKCHIWNLYGNVEKVYKFTRAFTAQTALNSLLQYAFDINERTPSKFMFNSKNGHVLSLEFRLSYSNQGFIDEKRPVPFRLTRNIESFIGPFLMKGVFAPAMASGATAICSNEADLDQTLQLLFRDDIVSWYLSKSSGSQRPIYELERQLSDRVRKNIYLVQNRLRECSVIEFKRNETDSHIDDGVRKLIYSATSIDNIAQMPSTYAPWL